MRKDCWIINKITNQVFYGSLNLDLPVTSNYPYLEVPENLIGKTIKWCTETNQIIEATAKCFKDDIDYQEKCFKEFEDNICLDILKADIAGVSTTVTLLKQSLEAERLAVIARINTITEAHYGQI